MGSLGEHHSLSTVTSQHKLKMNHSKLSNLKSIKNNEEDVQGINGMLQEMIEEEVELEQNEEQDSENES